MVPEPVVRPQKEEEKQSEAPAEESAKPKTDPESVASADTAPKTLQEKRASKGLRPGAWDVSQNVVAARMKELTGRRSYLKNFWYAAGEQNCDTQARLDLFFFLCWLVSDFSQTWWYFWCSAAFGGLLSQPGPAKIC